MHNKKFESLFETNQITLKSTYEELDLIFNDVSDLTIITRMNEIKNKIHEHYLFYLYKYFLLRRGLFINKFKFLIKSDIQNAITLNIHIYHNIYNIFSTYGGIFPEILKFNDKWNINCEHVDQYINYINRNPNEYTYDITCVIDGKDIYQLPEKFVEKEKFIMWLNELENNTSINESISDEDVDKIYEEGTALFPFIRNGNIDLLFNFSNFFSVIYEIIEQDYLEYRKKIFMSVYEKLRDKAYEYKYLDLKDVDEIFKIGIPLYPEMQVTKNKWKETNRTYIKFFNLIDNFLDEY